MIGLPLAHVGGLPIEETLGSFGPALLLVVGAASARLSSRYRCLRTRQQARAGARRARKRGR